MPCCVEGWESNYKSVKDCDVWNHDRHFVLIGMIFSLGLFPAISALGREYSTEPTELSEAKPAVGVVGPSHPAPAKVPPQPKRSAVSYSTENMAESPSGTDPNAVTAVAQEYIVSRARMVPRIPAGHRPGAPEGDVCCGGGYPVVGGTLRIRPGPYLAGWYGARRVFWPGLWDTDISYSWAGNAGGGDLIFGPYGYRYSWGSDVVGSDAFDCDQSGSAVESDPNTSHVDDIAVQSEDANEPPRDVPVHGASTETKHYMTKDK